MNPFFSECDPKKSHEVCQKVCEAIASLPDGNKNLTDVITAYAYLSGNALQQLAEGNENLIPILFAFFGECVASALDWKSQAPDWANHTGDTKQ